jgi:hypothetical protein
MPQSLELNISAQPAARLRSARVADGVVAGYIRELAHSQPDLAGAAPRTARAGDAVAAVRRLRGVRRRRSHPGSFVRPLAAPAGCSAA